VRSPGIVQADNLVVGDFPHAAVFISLTRSRLSAATEAASRASFSKRGARIARSSAVSPGRGHDAPATLPFVPAHRVIVPLASRPDSRLRSTADRGLGGIAPLRLRKGFTWMGHDVLLLVSARCNPATDRLRPANSALDRASRRTASSTSAWLPCGNRTICRAGRGRQQSYAQVVARLGAQPFDQRQAPAHPALVPPQQLRHFHLTHAVLAHQSVNDPGFFQFARAPTQRD